MIISDKHQSSVGLNVIVLLFYHPRYTSDRCCMRIFLGNSPCLFDKSDIKKMNSIKPYSNDSDTGNWITGRNLVPVPLCFHHSVNAVQGNNRCLLYNYYVTQNMNTRCGKILMLNQEVEMRPTSCGDSNECHSISCLSDITVIQQMNQSELGETYSTHGNMRN